MGRGARWTLGIAAVLGGCAILLPEPKPANPLVTFGVVAFLGLIAIACLTKIGRPMAIRVLGGSIFLIYAYYAYYEFVNFPTKAWHFFNEEHWINALIGWFLYGLPGLYVAVHGRFPRWGYGAKGFRGSDNTEDDDDADD